MKQKESAIDLLKFFAALLITNSHMNVFEPSYSFATGGAIGDVLFLFCSGYTLFMGRMGRFDNWYKRRLSRIYPPVICWGILAAFIFDWNNSIRYMMIEGGGWFVQCILLYYILAYFIRQYASEHLNKIFGCVLLIACSWFVVMQKDAGTTLYGWNYCKWAVFFLFFLQGAKYGMRSSESQSKINWYFGRGLFGLLLSTIIWYGVLYVVKIYGLPKELQLLSILPLLGISAFSFQICKSPFMQNMFNAPHLSTIIKCIGGLCYEIYLVQYTLFKSVSLPLPYPCNMVIMWLLIFLWAYVLHIVTIFVIQTVRPEEYNWKAICKIY